MTFSDFTHQELSADRRQSAERSRILVVDPDPDTRAQYVDGLARSGWETDGVDDGRVALAKAIASRPSAVVTETDVPLLDGFALCRLLRSDPATRDIGILVVTSDAEDDQIAKAKAAGADTVLRKPCSPAELTRAIQALTATTKESGSPRSAESDVQASGSTPRARTLSRRHHRGETTTPPSRPPALLCPTCDRPLAYRRSYIGGVNAKSVEQWDDYECASGCGEFQYRHRTRTLRGV